VPLSEATARRHTEAAGAAYAAVQAAEAARLEREAPAPPPGPAVQLVSADGAMVPLLGGDWAEAKTLVIGTVEEGGDGGEARASCRTSRGWRTTRRSAAARWSRRTGAGPRRPGWSSG
jgi:hypothetical protein